MVSDSDTAYASLRTPPARKAPRAPPPERCRRDSDAATRTSGKSSTLEGEHCRGSRRRPQAWRRDGGGIAPPSTKDKAFVAQGDSLSQVPTRCVAASGPETHSGPTRQARPWLLRSALLRRTFAPSRIQSYAVASAAVQGWRRRGAGAGRAEARPAGGARGIGGGRGRDAVPAAGALRPTPCRAASRASSAVPAPQRPRSTGAWPWPE